MRRLVVWLILVSAGFVAGVGYGLFSYEFEVFPFHEIRSLYVFLKTPASPTSPPGLWQPLDSSRSHGNETQELIEKLEAIGYATGSRPASTQSGVTFLQEEFASPGFSLYCSGHAAEAILARLDGEVIHTWRFDFVDAWPDRELPKDSTGSEYWRRVHLFENGDLLAIFEGFGLIKIDKNSHLLWALDGGYHHDVEVTGTGDIWALYRKAHVVPRIDDRYPVLEDFVRVMDSSGTLIREFSVLEAVERSPYAPLLDRMEKSGDLFHTNELEILDGTGIDRSPFFREGNLLVSILMLQTIAIIDPTTESVVWSLTGKWRGQHNPTMTPSGSFLLFNNKAGEKISRVMEFDPLTQEDLWYYDGGPKAPLYSEFCGSAQRLPNGNTLITESDAGRAIEVNPDKEIVWEFINPHQTGSNNELIAILPEVIRLPEDFPLSWLER